MMRSTLITRGLCLSALIAVSATPALAEGKADRARQAIAAAEGKIEVANKIGAIGDVPHLQAQAQASLRTAKEDLARGNKEDAIADANHAAMLADTAIGVSEKNRAEAEQAHRADAAAIAANAQQDAAAANARADAAQQAAAAASADAAAARAAPPVIVPAPAPTTTVSTETVKQITPVGPARAKVAHRTVTHKATGSRAVLAEKTTTTVTTTPN